MAKNSMIFVCNNCGYESPKWLGQCPSCQEWNSLEEVEPKIDLSILTPQREMLEVVEVKKIPLKKTEKISSNFGELDRVLGGGVLKSEVILMSGEPGVGKSTLLLQVAGKFKGRTIYVSAEESVDQVALRAHRVVKENLGKINLISAFEINSIIKKLRSEKPDLVIIDSIQTIFDAEARGLPGGIAQIKAVASKLVKYAKKEDVVLILVGQITKEGYIAGPKLLEHLVDVVLQFEGDDKHGFRMLRCFKNRFGPTYEVGLFEMGANGMVEVTNPALYFMENTEKPRAGITPGVIVEGNRVLIVEVQALSVRTYFSLPKRVVEGISRTKLEVITAIISKYTKFNLGDKDVYINIAGGLKIKEAMLDLPLALAILSSASEKSLPANLVAYGEVSLTGQIRYTSRYANLEKEIKRLGYKSFKNEYTGIDHISALTRIFK